MTRLTEQDRADVQADLRVQHAALEQHLNRQPLPHMVEQHQERTRAFVNEIARLQAMLKGGA